MNSTQLLTWFINNHIQCLFVKYGDGEYYAANYYQGGNCDGTPYTKWLGDKVKDSFIYNSRQLHSMMGAWHDPTHQQFWESLRNENDDVPNIVPNIVHNTINWVDFHTVLVDKETIKNKDRFDLFLAIKNSSLKKIYVANASMGNVIPLLNINSHVVIDAKDWFETQYEATFQSTQYEIENDKTYKTYKSYKSYKTLILCSAGMGAKYLISELHKLYPQCIYVDIGSGFDLLCRGTPSRTYNPSLPLLQEYLKPLMENEKNL